MIILDCGKLVRKQNKKIQITILKDLNDEIF